MHACCSRPASHEASLQEERKKSSLAGKPLSDKLYYQRKGVERTRHHVLVLLLLLCRRPSNSKQGLGAVGWLTGCWAGDNLFRQWDGVKLAESHTQTRTTKKR